MRKHLRGLLLFAAGVCVGVCATLCVWWFADFNAGIGSSVQALIQEKVDLATAPLKAPVKDLHLFIARNYRPPTDIEELAAFAKDDPGFDRRKFSELRLEFPSSEAVAIVWRLAPPEQAFGTNVVEHWRLDLDESPN